MERSAAVATTVTTPKSVIAIMSSMRVKAAKDTGFRI
jgi:hypothetical protein